MADPGKSLRVTHGEGRAVPRIYRAPNPSHVLTRFLDAPYNGVYGYIGSVRASTAQRPHTVPAQHCATLQRSRSLADPSRTANAFLRPRINSLSSFRRPEQLQCAGDPDDARPELRSALRARAEQEQRRVAQRSQRQLRDPMILPIDERFDLAPNPAVPSRVPGTEDASQARLEDLLPRLPVRKLAAEEKPDGAATTYSVEYERLDRSGHVLQPRITEVLVPDVVRAKKDAFLMTPAERRTVSEFEKREREAHKLMRAENTRVNRLRTLLQQRYPTGVLGYDGPLADDTETYRDAAARIQRDRQARQQAKLDRQQLCASLGSSAGVSAAVNTTSEWQEPPRRFSKRGCEQKHHTRVDLKNMMREPNEVPEMHPALRRRYNQILEGQTQGRDYDIVTGVHKQYVQVDAHPQRFIHPSLMIV